MKATKRAATVEYLRWSAGGYELSATQDGADAVVRVATKGVEPWHVMRIKRPLDPAPAVEWHPEWWPGESGAALRYSIERRVTLAVRAHHGTECDG